MRRQSGKDPLLHAMWAVILQLRASLLQERMIILGGRIGTKDTICYKVNWHLFINTVVYPLLFHIYTYL
jgi:hypothetical protein